MKISEFFVFNAPCDLFDKVMEASSVPTNKPMPKKIVVAAIAFAVCSFATLVLICYSLK